MASRNRGKGRPSIHNLIAKQPSTDELLAVRDALAENTNPIVVAVLGQTFLEHELDQHLRTKFRRHDVSSWGMLVGENGPLHSFSQKIVAGYALGCCRFRGHRV